MAEAIDGGSTENAVSEEESSCQWEDILPDRKPGCSHTVTLCRSSDECDAILRRMTAVWQESSIPSVLGLDCEWVPEGSFHYSEALAQLTENFTGSYNTNCTSVPAVALVQISDLHGSSLLIPTRVIRKTSQLLEKILKDPKVLKSGVGIAEDVRRIGITWGISVHPFLDLRFIHSKVHEESKSHGKQGLASIARELFDVPITKNPKITRSNWGAEELSQAQVEYAAQDSQLSADCAWMLLNRLTQSSFGREFSWYTTDTCGLTIPQILELCELFMDSKYKSKKGAKGERQAGSQPSSKLKCHKLPRLQKPLYSNIRLEAPDGQVLGFIDSKKSDWYQNQNLADLHPPTIIDGKEVRVLRMRYEPSKRPNKESDLYYMILRENACFVCGERNYLLRKNIVPRQYRKFFPDMMKTHRSHDIALLCIICHERACISERRLVRRYAEEFNAPLHPTHSSPELKEVRKLKSAAKALQFHREKLPESRIEELERIIRDNYSSTISEETLEEVMGLEEEGRGVDEDDSHGYRVVEEMKRREGGLPAFERAWRENFLRDLSPAHLPALWSLDHNQERYRHINETCD